MCLYACVQLNGETTKLCGIGTFQEGMDRRAHGSQGACLKSEEDAAGYVVLYPSGLLPIVKRVLEFSTCADEEQQMSAIASSSTVVCVCSEVGFRV